MTPKLVKPIFVLPLEGGINFRDFGGLSMAERGHIKPGLLFRSGALERLTPNDCTVLAQAPVQAVLDYRDADEAQGKPDVLWSGVEYFHCPANPLNSEVNGNLEKLTDEMLSKFDARAFMRKLYRHLPFNNPAYRQLVHMLMQPQPKTIVQHCALGKDRTGVGSALLLFALGADEDTVMDDYLLTEKILVPFRQQMLETCSHHLNDTALRQLNYVLSAHEELMMVTLSSIRERYSSISHWLMIEYGLGKQQCDALQAYYLE